MTTFLHLTNVGREVAEKIYERHCVLTTVLINLSVDPEQAEQVACRIEHAISDESFQKLKNVLQNDEKARGHSCPLSIS